MRKFVILLIVLSVLCPCGNALTISSQVTLVGGIQTATFWVDDYVIRVSGDGYYTYDSSEGRFTFYSNGFYTPGGRNVIDHYSPLTVAWEDGGNIYSGSVYDMGAIITIISDDPMPQYISTERLYFMDDSVPGALGFIRGSETAPLLASPSADAEKLFDARIGHFVYIFGDAEDGAEYLHVNYENYDGYISVDHLGGAGDISNRFDIVTTSSTVAFSAPDASSVTMGGVDPDTELLCTWENDLWYECMPYGGRRRYYIPKSAAKQK